MSGRGFISLFVLSLPLLACTGELTPTQGVGGDGDGDLDAATAEEAAFVNDALPAIQAGTCLSCHLEGGVSSNLFGTQGNERMQILSVMATPIGGVPLVSSPADQSTLVVYGDHTADGGGPAFSTDAVTAIVGWIQLEITAGNIQ